MTSRRIRIAGGLISATAILTPLVISGPIVSAEAATTPVVPVAKVVRQATKKTWAERRKLALKALSYVEKVKGRPYSWGASGPNAFDCSGLTSWAYRKAGVILPRVAHDQHMGVKNKISWNDLAPGDLVFFYGDGHVGIVSQRVGGKIYMIHAPHTGDHVRQVLLDGYRKATFSGAVRPY
jgi:cell wall-associated NlpC family hydrolase